MARSVAGNARKRLAPASRFTDNPRTFPHGHAMPSASPTQPWIVLKFGGTSVSKRGRWDTIGKLAARRRAEGARVLLVVSAVSGVTNALQALIDGHADAAATLAAAQALERKHREFAAELGVDADA